MSGRLFGTAFQVHLAAEPFATWLQGQARPDLGGRTRSDLVLLEPDVRKPKA